MCFNPLNTTLGFRTAAARLRTATQDKGVCCRGWALGNLTGGIPVMAVPAPPFEDGLRQDQDADQGGLEPRAGLWDVGRDVPAVCGDSGTVPAGSGRAQRPAAMVSR